MSHKFRDAFKGTLAQLCGWSEKDPFAQRKYSVISRGGVHNHSRIGHQSSISWGNQEIMLQLQKMHKQPSKHSLNPHPQPHPLPKVNNNQMTPLKRSPIVAITKRLRLFQTHPTHTSIESANTISNSSLQDLDEPEFTGTELARYMGELNRR